MADATARVSLRKRVTLFADEISRRSRPNGLSMRLRPFTARLCWCMVLAFHLVNGTYSLCLAYVYTFLARPEMLYYVKLLQLMPQDNYNWIIALYACISASNFFGAGMMILWTIYYRRVAYGKVPNAAVVASDTSDFNSSVGTARVLRARLARWSWLQRPRQVAHFFKGMLAALSVRGQLFDIALLVRELVEIASQAYQAHSSSFLVSTVWINQLYGVLMFLNCIANTAVFVLKREETGVRRFLCTAIDLTLDFTWSSVLPAHIALQYIPTFIEYKYSFPPEFLYSDTLYIRAVLDFKQLFMVSTTDAVTTMLPYLNMFLGLRNLKILLHQEAIDAMGGEFQQCSSGCMLQMHPWFSTHCACSVLEINCNHNEIEGSAQEIGGMFDALDERVLNSLIFTHCPALSIPPQIRRFRMLTGLEFYNVSLVSWSSDASLSLPYTPRLGYIYIVRSRLENGIPDGLTHKLAPNIVDIEIIASHIASIPDDLAAKWPSVVMLYLEHCGLQEFPRALASMRLTDISLVGNNISRLPDDLDWQHSWMYVMLDRNPLVALPENTGDTSQLQLITFQHTEVAVLPQWLGANASSGVASFAFGTPFCRARGNKDDVVLCSQENPYTTNGVFSLEMKDELRRLRTE